MVLQSDQDVGHIDLWVDVVSLARGDERVEGHEATACELVPVHDVERGVSLEGLYSLVATCEARRINPFEYLADVLARVQDHPARSIDDLLPGGWIAARDDD